jgi:NTE family protein
MNPPAVPSVPIQPAPVKAGGRARLGLVLSGGGARAAYQVGVLKAVADLLPRDAPSPFQVISGTSAGGIIAAIVASHAAHFRCGVISLERFWRNFHVDQVFRAGTTDMLRAGLRWLLALLSGGSLVSPPRSVFDNAPLRETLELHVNFARIRQHLDHGYLDALAINASSYHTGHSVAFYAAANEQAASTPSWPHGCPAELGLDHLMAGAAVPFLFPAMYINGDYFGDGAMRQLAPLSPAINLGADRLLIVGVHAPEAIPRAAAVAGAGTARGQPAPPRPPTFGQIFGFMLDTLFMDGLQGDLERLARDNLLIGAAGAAAGPLRRIEALTITPRADFGPIAEQHVPEVPPALRTLMRTMGAADASGRTLLSYLLFTGGFARDLIALGYDDAMAKRAEIQELLRSDP